MINLRPIKADRLASCLLLSERLGFDIVDFRKGYLEELPVEPDSVDIITSNCVINLSYDKKAVFSEMRRVLKQGGRIVISDIIAADSVPATMRLNPNLWGECLSGSLTQEELFDALESAGFYGLEALQKTFWREVAGCTFYSITFRGYKFQKQGACLLRGHKATYLGPFKGVTDEEGHYFPRNVPVEICTDTFEKLSVGAMRSSFILTVPDKPDQKVQFSLQTCCDESSGCC